MIIHNLNKIKHKYTTIYIDPPWQYDDKIDKIRGAERKYKCMSIKDILELPINRITTDKAHLYLWTTNSFLPEAFKIIECWKFQYKTILTWVKPTIGLGHYFRNNTEHILFATKNNLRLKIKNQPTWFYALKQKHSQKPEEFYEIIERCSYSKYLEMFARKTRCNWDSFGNEL